ncbi:MAG TPA: selenocysteine-specific translation elongation factor [Chroococcales cyanobacterium]
MSSVKSDNAANPTYFTLATAGHVDHGKTSVLRRLTGIDPDRLKEEKLRQMTTDLGFAHLRLPANSDHGDYIVGFIDVPGHGKFLKNMLAGVGGIHAALLVVASDEGPMPQTINHVKILSLLGVRRALVVMTKADLADRARQDDVAQKTQQLLQAHKIECLDIIRVSCTQESGFDALVTAIDKALQSLPGDRADVARDDVYLPIDRVFNKSGYGVVVTGTIVRGTLAVGDSIYIEPGSIRGRVRGLETFGHHQSTAIAGQRLAVNLSLKENKSLARGQTLLGKPLTLATTLIVKLEQAGDVRDKVDWNALEGQQIRLYHGTAECFGHLRWVEKQLQPDGSAIAQVTLQDPATAEPGDRFVLRFGDEGITGGEVLISARPRWLTRAKVVALAQLLVESKFDAALKNYLEISPQKLATESSIDCLLPRLSRRAVVEAAVKSGELKRDAAFLITTTSDAQYKDRIVGAIEKAGAKELKDGFRLASVETIRSEVMPHVDRQIYQHLLRDLVEAGRVVRDGDRLSLPNAPLSAADAQMQALSEKVSVVLQEHLCIEIAELARQVDADLKTVTAVLNRLAKDNLAKIVNYEYASSVAHLNQAHQVLHKVWQAKREISPSDFREALNTNRKYTMALLAFFDDQGITRRTANSRVLLKAPAKTP